MRTQDGWYFRKGQPTLCADVRRFSQLNNARKVFGTHRQIAGIGAIKYLLHVIARSDVEFPRRGAKRTVGRHSPLSRDRKSLTASTEVLASIDWQPGAVEHRIIFDKFWLCLEWEGSVRRRKFKASPLALRTLLSQLSGRLQLWKCNTSDISWRRPVS